MNFCDKNLPNDPGFTLELNQRMNYDQVVPDGLDLVVYFISDRFDPCFMYYVC